MPAGVIAPIVAYLVHHNCCVMKAMGKMHFICYSIAKTNTCGHVFFLIPT